MKELKILWMYHDIMDLYGDKGNMLVLTQRCRKRGIEITIDTCGIGEQKDVREYDLLFLGGGADREQMMLMDDLRARKEQIAQAMAEKSFVFLVCGGYQLFGQYYIAADGSRIDGLGFFDYYTDTGANGTRCIGNIAVDCLLDGRHLTAVGFENHGGQTKQVKTPLGKVLHGYGNTFQDGMEGFYQGQVFATYMHGPLLPKNPDIADFMIIKALQKKDPQMRMEELKPLDDTLEYLAKNVMLRRLGVPEVPYEFKG